MSQFFTNTTAEQVALWLPRARGFYLPPRLPLALARELPIPPLPQTKAANGGPTHWLARLWPAPSTPRPIEAILAEFEQVVLHTPPPAARPVSRQDMRVSHAEQLKARELEILRLIAVGLTNQEIADRLHLSVGTVKWYISHLYGKLQVHRRTEAVARGRALGLLDDL